MDAFCRGTRIMTLPCDHRFCSGCIRRCARVFLLTLSYCASPSLTSDCRVMWGVWGCEGRLVCA